MRKPVLAALAALVAALAGPAAAAADAPTDFTVEPIVIVPGYAGLCPAWIDGGAGQPSYLKGLVNDPDPTWTVTQADGTSRVVDGVPSSRVYVWTFPDRTLPANEQYDQCTGGSLHMLGRRLYNRLVHLRQQWGYDGKVDVLAVSLGAAVSRSCIRNFYGDTPDCADLIDDWFAIVPPNHGSDLMSSRVCPFSGLILAPQSICRDLTRTPQSAFLTGLNSPLPGSDTEISGPGEYSTAYSWNDDLLRPGSGGEISGAANHRVRAYPGSPQSADPTHATTATAKGCPGSPANPASAPYEWAAYELLDVEPHRAGTGEIFCDSGPIPAPPH